MKTITLPMEDAVELAVKENIERDRRCGLLKSVLVSPYERAIYEEEAEHLLRTTGENYTPEYADHHHIIVANDQAKGPVRSDGPASADGSATRR